MAVATATIDVRIAAAVVFEAALPVGARAAGKADG